ncbi:MAG: archaeosortase/exosortase family protein [Candidatus Micrarchaeota archaeon]
MSDSRKPFLQKGETEFLTRFFLIFFGLFAVLKIADLSSLLELIAGIEYSLAILAGIPATLSAPAIMLNTSSVEIVAECSGFVMIILLAALLWSTNIPNGRRIRYMLVFSPFLFVFNILRIFATLLTLNSHPSLFEFVHISLWFVDSAIVLLIWMKAQNMNIRKTLFS